MPQKIWFITGVSSGLGKAIAAEVISRGDFVIGTFRNRDQAAAFSQEHKANGFGLIMDMAQPSDIIDACNLVIDKFGKIDVLVNNAGIGLVGAIEESTMTQVRNMFEINFFAPLRLTQAFLPMFRKQKKGHIIQISSHGGIKAFAGFGIYNASKFALEGFSEALEQEIAPLGIKLTIVEPGPFRTNFAGNNLQFAGTEIEDYNATAGVFRQKIKGVDGKQEGDPAKAAKAIVGITELGKPPLRLPLGKTAIISLTAKLEKIREDMANFKEIAEGAVYS